MMKIISSRVYKARKRYVCENCGNYIEKNEHHLYNFGKREKKTASERIHIKCIKGLK